MILFVAFRASADYFTGSTFRFYGQQQAVFLLLGCHDFICNFPARILMLTNWSDTLLENATQPWSPSTAVFLKAEECKIHVAFRTSMKLRLAVAVAATGYLELHLNIMAHRLYNSRVHRTELTAEDCSKWQIKLPVNSLQREQNSVYAWLHSLRVYFSFLQGRKNKDHCENIHLLIWKAN